MREGDGGKVGSRVFWKSFIVNVSYYLFFSSVYGKEK